MVDKSLFQSRRDMITRHMKTHIRPGGSPEFSPLAIERLTLGQIQRKSAQSSSSQFKSSQFDFSPSSFQLNSSEQRHDFSQDNFYVDNISSGLALIHRSFRKNGHAICK